MSGNGHGLRAPAWFIGTLSAIALLFSLGWKARDYVSEKIAEDVKRSAENRELIQQVRTRDSIEIKEVRDVVFEINFRLCRLEARQSLAYSACYTERRNIGNTAQNGARP